VISLLFPKTDERRPRSRAQPRRDTEHRLTHDIDVWVASASAETSAGAFAPDEIGNARALNASLASLLIV
jgi:hypothetical protein